MSLLLLLFAAAAAPVPTKAQSDLSPAETRKLLEQYGVCIIKWRRAQASEAILRNVNNGELMRHYPRLVDGSCLPMRPASVMKVKFVGDQFRYALADALVRSELAALPAPSLDMVPALDHRDPTAPSRLSPKGKPLGEKAFAAALQSYDEAKAFSFLSRYGECVVRVNPAAARVLLLTRPESAEERAAFGAMNQAFATCLPENVTMSFGKTALRGTVAMNYYRLAKAAAGAPGRAK